MPAKHDSILENGHWEEIKPDLREADRTMDTFYPIGAKATTPARATKWFIDLVRPSIFQRAGGPRGPVRKTAYLDGLRGFAALLVYWGHHQLWARESIHADKIFEMAFGYNQQYYFACLPLIRIFFSGGHFSVTVFFVISGYVLSAKPLSLIHAGEYVKLGDNLTSALFRRWLRLYIPVMCTTFLYASSWHMFGGIWTDSEHRGSYRDEIWNWYCEFKNYSFVFSTGTEMWLSYNFHVWSIPVEFRGSIIIYTALLAFSRSTRNARLWCEAGLCFYFLYIVDGWFCAMFSVGMLLCDLDLLAATNNLPRFFAKLEPYKDLIFYNLLIISIYLGGVPSNSREVSVLRESRGWYYLSFLKPQAVFDQKWFYLFWAATFLVVSIPRVPWLKSFFEIPFNQYLGRISFGFYLVHGPVLWLLADRLYVAAGWYRETHSNNIPDWVNIFPLSKAGPLGLELSFLLPHLIILPVTFWLAEIVTKLFDEPSVRFAQWAYKRTLAPPEKIPH